MADKNILKSLWKFVRKSDNSKWNNLKHLCKVTTTVESTAEFCTVHHLLLSWQSIYLDKSISKNENERSNREGTNMETREKTTLTLK